MRSPLVATLDAVGDSVAVGPTTDNRDSPATDVISASAATGVIDRATGGVASPTKGRRRGTEPPAPQHDPNAVAAPADDEIYEYLGPQMRWIQLFLLVAFALAAWSLIAFSTARPLLWPALIVLAFNVAATTFSLATGMNKRRIDWDSHQRRVADWVPSGPFPHVDVFLPTCGESIDILRNTYQHVIALDWPGTLDIFVLDDANRPEVRDLAVEFGFHYEVRRNRGHLRKAGNLRHAFMISIGDLITIFDADFCPHPDFLLHLVPYFDDPDVAIVQSPQAFATTDSMNWSQRTAGATQEFFYRWVQPSRDRIGAANCVGTSAVYRRSALREVGGFAPIEHSEDLHTGRYVQQAGYTVSYVPVVLSRGLCPADLAAFLNQQYRWCMGSLSRVDNDHLGTRRRSTIGQWMAVMAGVLYYLTTAMNVFMLFIPGIVMAVFRPEDVRPWQLVPFLFGLWVYVVLFPLVSRTRWRFEVLRVQMAYSFAHAVAIWHRMIGREIGWVPTSVVGRSNALARSISVLGTLALGGSLGVFWAAIIVDVMHYGLWDFFMMVGFVMAYTYLAVPLLIEFVKILFYQFVRTKNLVQQQESTSGPTGWEVAAAAAAARIDRPVPLQTGRRPSAPNWNRITGWEVVGYTVAIVFIGALALGWFDIMLPWQT